jgi:adenylate cyclase
VLPTRQIVRLRLQRNLPILFGISLGATLFALLWWQNDVLGIQGQELGAYDTGLDTFTQKAWFPLGHAPMSNDIVIVAIDDVTLEKISANEGLRLQYGAWPYSRNVWAHTFSYLAQRGARAVVFDAVVDEPHPDAAGDGFMAQLARESGLPVYIGFNVVADRPALPKVEAKNVLALPKAPEKPAEVKKEPEEFPEEEAFPEEAPAEKKPKGPSPEEQLLSAAMALTFPVVAKELTPPVFQPTVDREGKEHVRHPKPPLPELLGAMHGFGVVEAETDDDGKMRRTTFVHSDGQNTYVSLSVAVAADLFKAEKVEWEPGVLRLGTHEVRINKDGTGELDYRGDLFQRYRTLPLFEVVDDYWRGENLKEKQQPVAWKLPQDFFAGKIVFIAGFSLGTGDQKPTPFDRLSPGVAKQAAELENILDGRFITYAPLWVSLLFAFLIAFFSVSLIIVVQSPIADLGWPLACFFLFFAVTGSILVATKVHVLSAMPSLAGTFASVATTAWNNFIARKDRQKMKDLFKPFMEADLVDIMVEQPTLPQTFGENQNVTAFFSDIEGFSSVSEAYRETPKALLTLLNRYLSRVTPHITKEGACIDKYIGDAVVALFGAPIPYEDHPLRACRAALNVLDAVNRLNRELVQEGLPPLRTRIGLNTATMLVGNIGSEQLLDFTAIGDGMNLAARLEGANKNYQTRILMGAGTFERVSAHVEARELDLARVAGKKIAVPVYELLALKGGLTPQKATVLEHYRAGLEAYRARKFEAAKEKFMAALSVDQNDGPSLTMATRCNEFLLNPPPDDWDGATDLAK